MISEILRNRCMNSKCSNLQMPLDGTKREETVARVQRIKGLWVVSYTEKLCIVVILFFLVANEVYCLLIQTVLTYSVLKSPLLLCFLCGSVLKYNLLLWSNLNFSIISPACHMILQKSNILIWCSRNMSDYSQCRKQCCWIFVETVIHFIFKHSLMHVKFKRI